MKKVWKGAAAAIAALSLGVTGFVGASSAYAAPTTNGQISVPSTDDHTYAVYQIATGDVVRSETEGSLGGTLSNAAAGTNFDASKDLAAALKAISEATGDDAAIANLANTYVTGNAVANITKTQAATGLASGYYLIKDTTAAADLENGSSLNRWVLVLVGDGNNEIEVTQKRDTVTSEKKVFDATKSDEVNGKGWNDSADASIGDTVEFRLKGTLPDAYDQYTYYKYNFYDTLSKGFDFNDDVEVYVGEKGTQGAQNVTDYFEVTKTENKTDGTKTSTDVKIAAKANYPDTETGNKYLKNIASLTKDSQIFVYYSATLNSNAVVTANKPGNDQHGGAATDNGNPNTMYLEYTSSPSEDKLGETTEDKVTVFTFKLIWNKVDENKAPLSDAEFQLMKWTQGGNGQWGWQYANGNENPYTAEEVTDEEGNVTAYQFTVNGLGAGKYKLVESQTPAGYNTMADLEFTITATHDEESDDPKLVTLTSTYTKAWGDKTAGAAFGTIEYVNTENNADPTGHILFDIENKKGSELPSTGGMGTVVLYTVGGLIVLIAGVGLAIALRRRQA